MKNQSNKIKNQKWIYTAGLIFAVFIVVVPRLVMWGMGHFGVVEPRPLTADFSLVDENNQAVTQETYAGSYRLVFFGFTFCPVICPTEMQKMSDILSGLDASQRASITPLFISVDPQRDTPEVLRDYTDHFDPSIIGLTGTADQVAKAEQSFKVYARRVPQGDDYTMDHSAFLYLIGPDQTLLALYRPDQTVGQVLKDLKSRLPSR